MFSISREQPNNLYLFSIICYIWLVINCLDSLIYVVLQKKEEEDYIHSIKIKGIRYKKNNHNVY